MWYAIHMNKRNDILRDSNKCSSFTMSITKGENTMQRAKIKKAIRELTNNDENIIRDIAYALNLILVNEDLTKALLTNANKVVVCAYEIINEEG